MSLIDLKKGNSNSRKKKLSVDEFIEQANLYAQGKDPLLDNARHTKKGRKYKNATFTLSHEHIKQLDALAKRSGLAKSHILRLLISELANGDNLTIEALLAHFETK